MSTLPRVAAMSNAEPFASSRFEIKRRLGEGSMGAVYLAYDRERGSDVALKSLRRVDAMSIYRFKREFRALSDVIHPNLVALYDLFQDGDLWYFTMEHVEGVDFLNYVLGTSRELRIATPLTNEELFETSPSRRPPPLRGPEAHGLELLFPTPLRDEDRLRNVAIQICRGLLAIHAAGKLHRDLKSDNVLVTADGRAKVLDFGIVTERAAGIHGTLELGVMGTPAYMSPEQAAGRPVTEATDWYALGVMLYEALTGNVPFDGTYIEVMSQKQQLDPPAPSQVVSGVSPDLDALCMRLLQRHPSARPEGLSVLRALERRRPPSLRPPAQAPSSSVPVEAEGPFVGRDDELAALKRYLAETDRGKPVVTFLHGPSGIGKTTLVERFVAELRQGERAVALKGRCYERETVPFKAFDSLVDSLSRHLRRLTSADAAEVLPRDVQALAHLFPVLRRVDVIAMARRRNQPTSDRKELRRRAFLALKELLCRLADRAPLLLFIDDLQWGDADSAQLMSELIAGDDAPAMLLLLAYRSGESVSSPCLQALFEYTRAHEELVTHAIELAPLSEADSVGLAERLLGPSEPGAAVSIGRESQGSPHLLTELVRHVQARQQSGKASSDTQRGVISFERALMKRVSELSPGARTLLELLSVAGRAVPEESLHLLATFDVDLQQAATELRGAKLARGVGTHTRRALETYHDRIRESVLAAMDATELELWHRRLASTLEASGSPDLEAIVEHLLGAGDTQRAQIYAIRAATQAAEALAFEKAARLFAVAVENQDDQGWGHELLVRWADSLVNAGHGRQAAAVYFDAARTAPEAEAQLFRRKAGLQLLQSGHEQEAQGLLASTWKELELSIPASRAIAAQELAGWQQRIDRRGLALAPRPNASDAARERLDTLFSIAFALAASEPDRAGPIVARCLVEALDGGDALRALRALCLYHGAVALPSALRENGARDSDAPRNGRAVRSPRAVLVAAEALEATLAEAEAQARTQFAHGFEALANGQLKPAARALGRAEELFSQRCPGTSAEARACRTALAYLFVSFYQLERLPSIAQWAQEADEHEDLLAGTRLRMLATFGMLVADRHERAAQELSQAAARWGRQRFDLTAMLHCSAQARVALYRGDVELCASVVVRYGDFFASTLSALPMLRGFALLWRARAALCASLGARSEDAFLARAEEDARAAAGLRLACLEQPVRLVRAGLAMRRGDPDTALALLEAAIADPGEQPDVAFMLAVAERRKGELTQGTSGRSRIMKADASLRDYGIEQPASFARMLAPGFN